MTQEYLAFGIFSLAILYSIFALIRFAFSFNKKNSPGCNDNCNCKINKKPKFAREVFRSKSFKI